MRRRLHDILMLQFFGVSHLIPLLQCYYLDFIVVRYISFERLIERLERRPGGRLSHISQRKIIETFNWEPLHWEESLEEFLSNSSIDGFSLRNKA